MIVPRAEMRETLGRLIGLLCNQLGRPGRAAETSDSLDQAARDAAA